MTKNLFWMLLSGLLALSCVSPSVIAQSLEDVGRKLGLLPNDFPIQESGYWTCDSGPGECVYWLDNNRVIFNGSHPSEIEKTPDGLRVWTHRIFIWNLKTNAVTRYADADKRSLCVVDGYIHYRRTAGDDVITLAGPIGKEVEIERRKKGEYPKPDPQLHGWNTRLSCHRYLPKVASPLLGAKVALKQGDGFLYFGSTMSDRAPVSYFRDGSTEEVQLPVERWKVTPTTVIRIEFDQSYLLFGPYRESAERGISQCPRKPVERQIYRLTTDGKLSAIAIPADRKLQCHVTRYAVLRDGIVVQTGAGHATNLDLSVSYLLRGGLIREVVRGVVNEYAVSPNGCLLAVGISTDGDNRKPVSGAFVRGHLKVIDFCAKGAG
jgi:hypothetical protein